MESKAELLAITPNSERLIEMAGRQCYKSEHRVTDTSYINFNKSIIAPCAIRPMNKNINAATRR